MTSQQAITILTLWSEKKLDTVDIAASLGLTEIEVMATIMLDEKNKAGCGQ